MMSALLRKLLIDDTPLVHAVNRERRLKLRFDVADVTPPAGADSWASNDTFHPSGAAGRSTLSLTIDQLLKRTIVVAFGENIRVSNLIKFLANNYGAVHASSADSTSTEALRDLAWGGRMVTPKGQ